MHGHKEVTSGRWLVSHWLGVLYHQVAFSAAKRLRYSPLNSECSFLFGQNAYQNRLIGQINFPNTNINRQIPRPSLLNPTFSSSEERRGGKRREGKLIEMVVLFFPMSHGKQTRRKSALHPTTTNPPPPPTSPRSISTIPTP